MDILCCTSNEYSPYAGVMLTSLFENNKTMNFNVFVFTTGLDIANAEKMMALQNKYNHTIHIMSFTKEMIGIKAPGTWGIFPFLKLYASHVLTDIDRLLYLDTDMIITRSVSSIEQIDINNYYIALAPDCGPVIEHRKRLGISQSHYYGNTGLIYYNLKKCREEQIWEKSVTFINENDDKVLYADQDVFNKICAGHILELGLEWNMQASYYLNRPIIQPEYKKLLMQKKKEAIVLHYTCVKPWYKDCDFPLRKEYLKYERISGWNIVHTRSSSYNLYYGIINGVRYIIQKLGLHTYEYLYE